MKIVFIVARVGDPKNVIQKLSIDLAERLRKKGYNIDIYPFCRKTLLQPHKIVSLLKYDLIMISNVGLHCSFYSLLKRIRILNKPFLVISYGSDIRSIDNEIIP